MDGFTKLFGSIVLSSIWNEDDKTRLVWITLLALKNGKHKVECSTSSLATLARVSVEDCRAALVKLSSPDPDSKNKDHDGRRIMELEEGGWFILSGERYQKKLSKANKNEYSKNWMAQRRAKPLTGEVETEQKLNSGEITQEQADARAAITREHNQDPF